MRSLIKQGRAKALGVCLAVVAVAQLAMASLASAAIEFDAKDFTEPLETQMTTAVPLVVAFIAAVFGVGWLIRWVQKRANSAK